MFDERQKALFEFTRRVVKNVRVDDAAVNAVAAFYDARQLVELLFAIGSYMMLARIMEVAELEVDAVDGAAMVEYALSRREALTGS